MENSEDALERYAEALSLLHEQKWQQAAKLFERLAAAADGMQLADRARQNLALCRRRLAQAPSEEDPYLKAVFVKNQGDYERALELCLQPGRVEKEERYAYLAASIKALAGDEDEALAHLETAIRLEPKNRVHAYHDPDFQALRGQEAFTSLVAGESES